VAFRDDGSVYRGDSGTALTSVMPALRLGSAAKRLADIVVATLCLILLSPLLVMAFVAIRLGSPGPVLVRVKRYGYQSRPIQVLKFRLVDARTKSDRGRPRLTRVGRTLSQTGIDKLPRLVNVLRGELSIIGPPPSAHPKMSLNVAKPGMIQWAQIIATRERD
jgi:putative colanic acid biosysnthesis UDP-glucose lipid carrier transferase